MSLAVPTKLRVIRVVAGRFNADLAELSKHLDAMPQKVEKAVTKHLALTLLSDGLGFRLVADVDAFLFETRSVYELTGNLLKEFFARILDHKLEEAELKKMLETRNIDTTWIEVARGERKLFFHETAPWIAVEVKEGTPHDLVILKRNMHDLADPNDYVRFEEYRAADHEFVASMATLQAWVLEDVAAEDHSCGIAAWGNASILMSNPLQGIGASPKSAQLAQDTIDRGRQMGAKTEREHDYLEAVAAYYEDFANRPERMRQLARAKAYEALAAKYPTDVKASTRCTSPPRKPRLIRPIPRT